jgi:hypothetical protein
MKHSPLATALTAALMAIGVTLQRALGLAADTTGTSKIDCANADTMMKQAMSGIGGGAGVASMSILGNSSASAVISNAEYC